MSWEKEKHQPFSAPSQLLNASFLHADFKLQAEEILVQQTVFVQTSFFRISFCFPNFGKGKKTELANMLQSCLMP